tara:strand:- start:2834 stop:3874 length:1041 start_codon:yes stop_codon:yes gene_type:complete
MEEFKMNLLDDNDEVIQPQEIENEEVVEQEEETIDEVEEIVDEVVEQEEEEYEYVDIDSDEQLIDYIKENPEILNQLTPSEQRELPEDVKKYLEFREETNGRGFSDFLEYQKDFSEMSTEDKVKKLIQENNPTYTKEDIEDVFEERYAFDEDYDDEKDVRKKKRELRKISDDAEKYFTEQKSKWGTKLGSSEESIPEDYVQSKQQWDEYQKQQSEITEINQDKSNFFVNETDKMFNEEFKGFEFKVGEQTINHLSSNPKDISESQKDLSGFFGSFLDEKGYVKDVEGYHKAMYVAMNYESILESVYETAVANHVENESMISKNIDMGRARKSPEGIKSGIKMKIIS